MTRAIKYVPELLEYTGLFSLNPVQQSHAATSRIIGFGRQVHAITVWVILGSSILGASGYWASVCSLWATSSAFGGGIRARGRKAIACHGAGW